MVSSFLLLFALLNPLGGSNPLYVRSTLNASTPHGLGSRQTGNSSFTLTTSGSESFHQFEGEGLDGNGNLAVTAFTRDDTNGVDTFLLHQDNHSTIHEVVDGSGSTADSVESFHLDKTGQQTFTQHQAYNSDLGYITLSRQETGNDTFDITDQESSSWHQLLDDVGSTSDGCDSFTLTQNGGESYTQDIEGYAADGAAVANSLTRTDNAQASFTLNESDTSAYHLVVPGTSIQDGSDNYAMPSKTGSESFTQTLAGHDGPNNLFVVDQLTSTVSGSDSYSNSDQGQSSWTDLPDETGSSDSGTDNYSQTTTNGTESFSQSQSGQDVNGIFTTQSVNATNDSSDSFTLSDNGTSAYHTVLDDEGSTDDGTDNYSSSQTGSETNDQLLVAGLDDTGTLAVSLFSQVQTSSDTFTMNDHSTDKAHYNLEDEYNPGSFEDDTDDMTQSSSGSESAGQTMTGHDDMGGFTVDSLVATDNGGSSFTSLEISTSKDHLIYDSDPSDPPQFEDDTDNLTQNNQGYDSYTQYQSGHDENGAFNLDSFSLDDDAGETNVAVEVSTSNSSYTLDDGGSTEQDTDNVVSQTTEADSYTLHQEGQDQNGSFLTTTEHGHQTGNETFIVDETATVAQQLLVSGGTQDNQETDTQHRTGFESFILDKTGAAVNGTFQISNLDTQRSGNQNYHRTAAATTTWSLAPDDNGSTQDGTASSQTTTDGVQSYTQEETGMDVSGGFVATLYTTTQQGNETYTNSTDTFTQWHTVFSANPYAAPDAPIATEDGQDQTDRTSDGTDSYTLNEVGAGGADFKLSTSLLTQSGTETYVQTETSDKTWENVIDNTGMPTNGYLNDQQSHTGHTVSSATQTVLDGGSDAPTTVDMETDFTSSETFTETSTGNSSAINDFYPDVGILTQDTVFAITKQGDSTTVQDNTSTQVNGVTTASAFSTNETGDQSSHLDETITKEGEGLYCFVYAFLFGTVQDRGDTPAAGSSYQEITKDTTSSYGLDQLGTWGSVTSSTSNNQTNDSYHEGNDIEIESWNSTPTAFAFGNGEDETYTTDATKDGTDSINQSAVGSLNANNVLATVTTSNQASQQSSQTITTDNTVEGPLEASQATALAGRGSKTGQSTTTDAREDNTNYTLFEVWTDNGTPSQPATLLDVDLNLTAQESFTLGKSGSQTVNSFNNTSGVHRQKTSESYSNSRQGSTTMTVQEVSDPNFVGVMALSLTQSGNETTSASMSGTYYTYDNDGQGNITTNNVTANSSLTGSDSFVLTLGGYTLPGLSVVVTSSSLQGNGQQSSTSSQGFTTNWSMQSGSVTGNGNETTSQGKQDQLSYNFTIAGHDDPENGWVSDANQLFEQAAETFAYGDSGSRSQQDQLGSLNQSGTASFSGLDSFTLNQNPSLETLDRTGNGQFSVVQSNKGVPQLGPGQGNDSYTIDQSQAAGNPVGSQSGTASLTWSWPNYFLPISPLVPLPDNGSETLGWGPYPGSGITGSSNPLGRPGQSFAEGVLGAANGPLVTAADAQGATDAMTGAVINGWTQTATSALGSSADQVTLWVGQLRTGLAAWQQANSQMLSAVTGHFTSDARWKAVNVVHIWLAPGAPWQGNLLRSVVNFVGGVADALTGGLTIYVRNWVGLDSVVDMNSSAYRVGSQVGQLANIVLMVTPMGAMGTFMSYVQMGLQAASLVGGAVSVVAAWQDGNVQGVILGLVQLGLTAVRGVSACAQESAAVAGLQRLLHGVNAGQAVVNALGNFTQGDWFGGLVNLADAGANMYMMGCFAAGTPLLTPEGSKVIEAFQRGDKLLARSEFDPYGPVEVKEVEEVFVNMAPIVHLHLGGQVIRTTAEHRFFVYNKGWLAVKELAEGDWLCSRDGQWITVEEVFDTGEYEPVYNVRVADFHTYYVGDRDWGFSVWSHNACKTGPKTGENAPHNAAIREAVSDLPPGDKVIAGGRTGIPEAIIDTNGGMKSARRPDILVQRTDGSKYGMNVGLMESSGAPVLRERNAMNDLVNQGGLFMNFIGYGYR